MQLMQPRQTMQRMRRVATRSLRTWSVSRVGMAVGLSLGLVSLGCSSDTTGPSADLQNGSWDLQLNHRAITMSLTAPSNQLQLQAVPLTVHGDTIATTARVHYTSSDSAVFVDSTGLLTAKLVRTGVTIVASVTIPNGNGQDVTLADTALVNVNNPPAPARVFTTLRIATPGDSATFSPVIVLPGPTVTAFDASDSAMAGVNVLCQSSNRDVLDIGRGKFNSYLFVNFIHLPGTITYACGATIYGVRIVTSIPVRVGFNLYKVVRIDTVPNLSGPPDVVVPTIPAKIGVGGVIGFNNFSKRIVDIVFDDPTAADSVQASERNGILYAACFLSTTCKLPSAAGNLLLQPANNTLGRKLDFRKFTMAGTYPYHSEMYPTLQGTIIVVP
jgi:hypothetical protein